ncbi:protocadherin alpha-5-like [Watersipora subatra]|uniref:protocadherin alpha-5-like n=1 Tax=Watersipora subatra TaxID=2589382 RepID=UPI00355B6C6C
MWDRTRATLWIFVTLWLITSGIEIHLIEEQEAGVILVDLSAIESLPLSYNMTKDRIRYKVLGSSEYFNVSLRQGVVSTKTRIDREDVCNQGVEECILHVDIIAIQRHQYHITRLTVIIEDIDDNLPMFTITTQTLTLLEGDDLDTVLKFPTAIDLDSQEYTDTAYRLVPLSVPAELSVKIEKIVKNTIQVSLTGYLDCEVYGRVNFAIEAFSLQNPSSVSVLSVTVIVSDVNDNRPIFLQDSYRIAVAEDIPVGTVITRVTAVDKDVSEANNQVKYFLDERKANSHFEIYEETGESK